MIALPLIAFGGFAGSAKGVTARRDAGRTVLSARSRPTGCATPSQMVRRGALGRISRAYRFQGPKGFAGCVLMKIFRKLAVLTQDCSMPDLFTYYEGELRDFDNSAVRHAMKSHGSAKEVLRGQIPITEDDLMRIPEIVATYESLSAEKNKRGQDVIIYTKTMDDGVTFYVEEIRLGRHELAASTLYKRKKDDSPTLID